TSFTYDPAGNLLSRTDARSINVVHQYDALNRRIATDYPNDPDVTFIYDETTTGGPGAIGHLTTMVDESGTTKFSYDERGNLLSKSHSSTAGVHGVSYTYDDNSKVTSITYPGGLVVDYDNDAAGRISEVTMTAG